MSDSNEDEKKLYRIVAMIPTEMYVDADDIEEAYGSIDWLFQQYPPVDAPVSTESDRRTPMAPRILTVEYV